MFYSVKIKFSVPSGGSTRYCRQKIGFPKNFEQKYPKFGGGKCKIMFMLGGGKAMRRLETYFHQVFYFFPSI